ncbi:MAG: transcriptional regulator, LacI family protein [Rhodocyclales bacterium]|nr:transcriptional regulator, LacI family protein [Rhodocyclales bacterium]
MAPNNSIHVGFILINPVFLWAVTSSMMQAEAQRRGVRLTIVPVTTIDEQLAEIERQLSLNVDALIIKPMNSEDPRLLALARRAIAARIPIITVDSKLAEINTCTVGSDNKKGQALVANHIFECMGGRGKVAYFEGDQRLNIGRMRAVGFHELLPRYPDIQLAYQSVLDWDKETPVTVRERRICHMREALAQHADLGGVIVATDVGALDVSTVIAEHGLTGKILVSGFDAIPEAFIAIRTGRMTATTRQSPRSIAAAALDAVASALNGEVLPDYVYADIDLVTRDNADELSLDTLQTVPGLIRDLAEHHQRNRQLQQAIISTQKNILETVAAVSNAVSQIREQSQMMLQVVDLLAKRFDLEHVALYFHNDGKRDGQTEPAPEVDFLLQAASGETAGSAQIRITQTDSALLAECTASQLPAVWHDKAEAAPSPAVQRRPNVQSELVLPLKSGQQLIGVLDLQSLSAKAFDADAQMVLLAIAEQVAIAIDNARLYAETVRNAQEQAENRERLVVAEKMASLGRLTGGIAHEMNTPLAAVRSAVVELAALVKEYREAVDDPDVNADDHREIAKEMDTALNLASASAEKAAGFVRSVKAQTRDTSTQQLVSFNAVPVIQEAVVLLSHALRKEKCDMQFEFSEEHIELFGSPTRLAQAVTNLVGNAIDASACKGGGPIKLALSQTATNATIRVTDSGCGIPTEVLSRMYDPMFSTKPFGQSTGLGLTIVHDVVTGDFRGSINVDTKVGEGTTFILHLSKGSTHASVS